MSMLQAHPTQSTVALEHHSHAIWWCIQRCIPPIGRGRSPHPQVQPRRTRACTNCEPRHTRILPALVKNSPASSCQLAKVTRSIVPVFDANKRRTRAYCALTSRCNRRYIPYSAQDCQPRILLQPNLLPFPPTCAQNPAHPKSWQRGRRKATKQLCLANTRNQSEDASIAGIAKHVSLSRLLLSACRHKPLPTTRLLMRNPLAGAKCQER
jgi:hypothetical protein